MVFLFGLIFLLIAGLGAGMLFFPASFSGEPDSSRTGMRFGVRFGIFGGLLLIVYLVRLIISAFPLRIQFIIVRIIGSGILVGVMLLGGTLLYGHMTGKYDLSRIETRRSGQLAGVARRQAEMKLQVRGPEYTTKVKELVAAQKPEWDVDSSEALELSITDKNTKVGVMWDLEEYALNEMSEADSAAALIEETSRLLRDVPADLKRGPSYDSGIAKRSEQLTASTGATPPDAAVPPLEEADKLLEAAKAAWQQGNIQGALASAENARKIRAQHLGANHPKVAQVDQMIAAARQKIAAPAAAKP